MSTASITRVFYELSVGQDLGSRSITVSRQDLALASLAVIGLGLILHIAGLVVRGQTIRKNLKR